MEEKIEGRGMLVDVPEGRKMLARTRRSGSRKRSLRWRGSTARICEAGDGRYL